MEIASVCNIKPLRDYTVPDVVRSFVDYSIFIRGPSRPDSSDGYNGSDGPRSNIFDGSRRPASELRGCIPAQLLFDVLVLSYVVSSSAMLPELVRRSDVYIVLAYGIVLCDRYVARVGFEGVLNRSLRCGFHDAPVPLGLHLHATYEHPIVPAALV